MSKQWIRIRVRKCEINPEEAYVKILHEHLRYAGVINIDSTMAPREKDYKEEDYIEVRIPLKRSPILVHQAEQICERIKSFGDHAEVE